MRLAASGLIGWGIVLVVLAHVPSTLRDKPRTIIRGAMGRADCGVMALVHICKIDNNPRPLKEIRLLSHCTSQGTSLFNLKEAAESVGYKAEGVRIEFDSLREIVCKPYHYAILHIKPNHFIAVLGAAEDRRLWTAGLRVSSPKYSEAEVRELGWEGVALLLDSTRHWKMLVIDPPIIDLGKIPVSNIKDFSAMVRNIATEKVVIGEIKANCGCANVQIAKLSLEPGESAQLTGVFRASSQPGVSRKRITFTIKHPLSQVFEVELAANVVPILPVTPEKLVLTPNFITGEKGIAEAVMRNDSKHTVRVGATSPQNGINVEISQHDLQPREETRIRLEVAPKRLTADLQEITVVSSHPDACVIRIPVYIHPTVEVKVEPLSLRLGVTVRSELKKRSPFKIAIRGAKAAKLGIEQIEAPAFLRTKIISDKEEDLHHLLLYISDNMSGTCLSGKVKIRMVDHASGRRATVRIPVSGLLRNAD